MKKFFAAIIFSVVLAVNSFALAAEEPKILADSAILVEASTGRIIWEKNSDLEREPASMTKMLTCVLALEKLDPPEEIVMSQAAVNAEDNTLSWSANDSVSAHDMVTAVMLVSENGGAIALAQTISGTTENFADLMNDKARALGCKNSHFVNPNGLPNPNHVRRGHGTHCRLLHEERRLPRDCQHSAHVDSLDSPEGKMERAQQHERTFGQVQGRGRNQDRLDACGGRMSGGLRQARRD